jgi:hypothetical protein
VASDGVAARSADRWFAYGRWNAALAQVVYGYQSAGVPVFLDPEDEVLHEAGNLVGDTSGAPREALIEAVRPTLNPPDHSGGIFGRHLFQLRRWRPESGEPPPIVALLAVLCLAAEDMRESDGFAANNYYDRLMPLLGVKSDADKARVIKTYRDHSFDLWESLNSWLDGLHGERGLPTAYSYALAHVGRPLSQALIRAADREKLQEFFEELGLDSRARLSPADMEPLLAEWIGRVPSPASHQIQAMWKRAGARERITEIACQVLELWEPTKRPMAGSPVHGARTRSSSVRLLALLRSFPAASLELNVTGPRFEGEPLVHLLDPKSNSELGQALEIEELPDGRWRLSQPNDIDAKSLLEGVLRLRTGADAVVDRRPRRLIPFRKDDLLQVYAEVERIGLGEEALLLCQAGLSSPVEDALSNVARPGFRLLNPTPPGCPEGWAVIADVQVLGSYADFRPKSIPTWPIDLNVLQPLSTSQLVLEGGLQLPGRVRRWSSLAPPELRVAAEGAIAIDVLVERVATFEGTTPVFHKAFRDQAAILSLAEVGLEDADYEINVETTEAGSSKRQRLNSARLRLRSADHPNLIPSTSPNLARPLMALQEAATSAIDWDGESLAIRGAQITGPANSRRLMSGSVGMPPWWENRKSAQGSGISEQELYRPTTIVITAAEPSDCINTGAHYLQLPPFLGRTSKTTIEGVCKYCGLVKRFPARYHAKTMGKRRAPAQVPTPPSFHASFLASVSTMGTVSPDVALDALSHDGAGPAAWLEQVALQVNPSQLFVDRFVRNLEKLGHIEVKRDSRTCRPLAWDVTEPCLVGLVGGGFALTGHRSRHVVRELETTASDVGVALDRQNQGLDGPDRITLAADSHHLVAQIADTAGERMAKTVRVVPDAARTISEFLPPLRDVVAATPRQAMVSGANIHRWDSKLCRWRPVGDAHVPGAYQLMATTTIYCIRDVEDVENGTMRRFDARFVKYAAMHAEGEQLLGYDSATQTLYLPLGAELPGIYERPAVLCSGRLPVEDERQRLTTYNAVPPDIAAHLSLLLTEP